MRKTKKRNKYKKNRKRSKIPKFRLYKNKFVKFI